MGSIPTLPTMKPEDHHPSQWSGEVLEAIRPHLDQWRLPVHDPFAGTGVRLGRLCDAIELEFSGTEIEPEFIADERVIAADSTLPWTYPLQEHVICTSPVYPNGMADHFHARDDSRRHTYRQALTAITGSDRPLNSRNMGRYGARSGWKALGKHFEIAHLAAANWWPAKTLVNVSDFILGGQVYSLVDKWRRLLEVHRYAITDEIEVKTRRQRHGANGDARVDHEVVLVAVPEFGG